MGIRQQLNENYGVAAAGAAAAIVLCLLLLLRPGCSAPHSGGAQPALSKEFFSVDDGKTWFADDAGRIPPFNHQGKPAYRVRVYRCAHGKEFASHLERYADADRQRLESLMPKRDGEPPSMEFLRLQGQFEVKKPAQGDWVKMSPETAAKAYAIQTPRCPEGKTEGVTRVAPQ